MQAWALIIGINKHPEDAMLPDLHGAVADAADFAEWALHPKGGKVAPERLFFWTHPAPTPAETGPLLEAWLRAPTPWPTPRNPRKSAPPDFDRAPRSGDIVAVADAMGAAATQAAEPQRAYVLMAGHGVQVRDGPRAQTCFLAGDYADGAGVVPCDELSVSLQSNGFGEVLLFLDCCRSNLGRREPTPRLFKLGAGEETAHAVGHAAKRSRPSFEFPEQRPVRGVFTYAVTEALRARRGEDGALTVKLLGDHVYGRAPALVGPGRDQEPQFTAYPDNPPIVITMDSPILQLRNIVIDFGATPAGARLHLIDHKARPICPPLTPGAQPASVPAATGFVYALEDDDRRVIRTFRHDGPGDTHVQL
jgi:hypothetical protein